MSACFHSCGGGHQRVHPGLHHRSKSGKQIRHLSSDLYQRRCGGWEKSSSVYDCFGYKQCESTAVEIDIFYDEDSEKACFDLCADNGGVYVTIQFKEQFDVFDCLCTTMVQFQDSVAADGDIHGFFIGDNPPPLPIVDCPVVCTATTIVTGNNTTVYDCGAYGFCLYNIPVPEAKSLEECLDMCEDQSARLAFFDSNGLQCYCQMQLSSNITDMVAKYSSPIQAYAIDEDPASLIAGATCSPDDGECFYYGTAVDGTNTYFCSQKQLCQDPGTPAETGLIDEDACSIFCSKKGNDTVAALYKLKRMRLKRLLRNVIAYRQLNLTRGSYRISIISYSPSSRTLRAFPFVRQLSDLTRESY